MGGILTGARWSARLAYAPSQNGRGVPTNICFVVHEVRTARIRAGTPRRNATRSKR